MVTRYRMNAVIKGMENAFKKKAITKKILFSRTNMLDKMVKMMLHIKRKTTGGVCALSCGRPS
jgi:hypothetical protein